MTKNPFLNALAAIVYIAAIATFFYYGSRYLGPISGPIAPMTMLSLLVLSAALMGLIFFYHPVRMYLDGEKQGAVTLLFKTVGIFACVVLILVIILFLLAARM